MITIIRDSGLINRIALHFGMDLKLGLMYHANGMIIMNLWFNIPFAAMMITAGLGAIPDSIIEAARDVGAGKFKVFTSMILPLSLKDVIIAGTFVFMTNVGSFTTPYLMGGNSPEDAGYRAVRPVQQISGLQPFGRAVGHHVPALLGFRRRVYIYTNLKEKDWEQ